MTDNGFAGMLKMQADDFAERCTNCGECLEACPAFPMTKFADQGAEAIMEKITGLLKTGDISDEACDMVFSCTHGCGHHCMGACPVGLMPNLIFMHLISKIKESGKDIPPYAYHIDPESRFSFKKVFSAIQKSQSDSRWIKKIPENPTPVDVVLFGGCTTGGIPHIMSEAMGIIDKMGIQFVALDAADRCCGVGHVVCGQPEKTQKTGEKLIADIAAFQPKQAVFSCPGCYLVIAGTLAMSMEIPFAITDITSFFLDNLDKIPFQNNLDKKIALHDSCVISAMPDFAEKPRQILSAIPGVNLIELAHNRNNSQCCGGVASLMNPPIANKMKQTALNEAEDAGIQVLATYCAGCHESFSSLEKDCSFEIENYISLIAESVGVKQEDTFKTLAGCTDLKQALTRATDYINASNYTVEEIERILPEYLHQFLPKDSG
jgi:Fe-S oxidoreductase